MTRWYQFHARKALFEVPKSRIYIFGLKMTPPPLKVFLKFICFGAVTRFTTSELHPSRFCPFFLHLCFSMFFFLLIRWSQETHLNVNLRHHMYWWWCYYWWFWCWWRWCWWTESWHQGMKNSFDAQRAKLSGSSPAWIIDNDESDGVMVLEVSLEWYCSCKRFGWYSLW